MRQTTNYKERNMTEAQHSGEQAGTQSQTPSLQDILLVEPFYCGSHKQLMDCLLADRAVSDRAHLVTMSGKKWHWRARTSALYFSHIIGHNHQYKVLFASCVLNLAELVALRPDLAHLHKVIYFHENQLQYPVRKHQDRDFQYGYNQVMSCLVADMVLFNSKYNMESFLGSIKDFFKLMPDYRPKDLEDKIRHKCKLLYFPMQYEQIKQFENKGREKTHQQPGRDISSYEEHLVPSKCSQSAFSVCKIDLSTVSRMASLSCQETVQPSENTGTGETVRCSETDPGEAVECTKTDPGEAVQYSETDPGRNVHEFPIPGNQRPEVADFCVRTAVLGNIHDIKRLHIVWPHRWEHDKDPQTFFTVLFKMHDEGLDFTVSVLGETFADVPVIFEEAKVYLKAHIKHWGFQIQKSDYYRILQEADVVVSTSKHEFFGVAMLEAVYLGCYPLCPRSLVYPEIYADCCLYSTPAQLYKRLRSFCRHPFAARSTVPVMDLERFSWEKLRTDYLAMLRPPVS